MLLIAIKHLSEAKNKRKILDKAVITAAATDNELQRLLRYDENMASGITNVVKEHHISDLMLTVQHEKGMSASFLNNLNDGILAQCNCTTLVYKSVQPLSTIKRHIVIVLIELNVKLASHFGC